MLAGVYFRGKNSGIKVRSDIEVALDNKTIPWANIEYRCNDFWIFNDQHLVFVPVMQKHECLLACYKGAYQWGVVGMQNKSWTGFSVEQHIGESAGQTVHYPHVCMKFATN